MEVNKYFLKVEGFQHPAFSSNGYRQCYVLVAIMDYSKDATQLAIAMSMWLQYCRLDTVDSSEMMGIQLNFFWVRYALYWYIDLCSILCLNLLIMLLLLSLQAKVIWRTRKKIDKFDKYRKSHINQFFTFQLFLFIISIAIYIAHLPVFYPPIGSDQPICQCFTP